MICWGRFATPCPAPGHQLGQASGASLQRALLMAPLGAQNTALRLALDFRQPPMPCHILHPQHAHTRLLQVFIQTIGHSLPTATRSGSGQEQSTHCPPQALPPVMLISGEPEAYQGSHPRRRVQLPHHDLGDPSPSMGSGNARSWSAQQTDAPVAQSRSRSSFPRSYARLHKRARLNKPVCLSRGKLLAFIQKSLQPSLPKQQVTLLCTREVSSQNRRAATLSCGGSIQSLTGMKGGLLSTCWFPEQEPVVGDWDMCKIRHF